MAVITLLASGAPQTLLPALSTRGLIQNVGGSSVEVENAVDPTDGLLVGPGEILNLGFSTAWTAAWTGRSPNGVDVSVRVAFE